MFFSQQKLVLRNNSANTTQQLRLLIRGQDQDCFQVIWKNADDTLFIYLVIYVFLSTTSWTTC